MAEINSIEGKIIKTVKELLKTEITSYEIARRTGVTRQLIDNYRNNIDGLNRMALKNIAPLYDYALKVKGNEK